MHQTDSGANSCGASRRWGRAVAHHRTSARRAGAGAEPRLRWTSSSSAPGLAGLCAAFELEQRGHRVTMLEADQRHIGGRTRTLRFGDGLYGEAGAMRIPTRHEITRHYVREFGLPLRKFVLSNPKAYYFLRGERAAHCRRRASSTGSTPCATTSATRRPTTCGRTP